MSKYLERLHCTLRDQFSTVEDALRDERCKVVQPQIVRSAWDPRAPGAPAPDPEVVGNNAIAEFYRSFNVFFDDKPRLKSSTADEFIYVNVWNESDVHPAAEQIPEDYELDGHPVHNTRTGVLTFRLRKRV